MEKLGWSKDIIAKRMMTRRKTTVILMAERITKPCETITWMMMMMNSSVKETLYLLTSLRVG